MQRYRKKPVVIEAHQWFKNGDHPGDNCHMVTPEPDSATQFEPFLSEGEVVRYFRHPDVPGETPCRYGCGHRMHDHGWIDTPDGGSDGAQVVCPGDWVITGVKGEHYPCKPDVFEITYEPADGEAVSVRPDDVRVLLDAMKGDGSDAPGTFGAWHRLHAALAGGAA